MWHSFQVSFFGSKRSNPFRIVPLTHPPHFIELAKRKQYPCRARNWKVKIKLRSTQLILRSLSGFPGVLIALMMVGQTDDGPKLHRERASDGANGGRIAFVAPWSCVPWLDRSLDDTKMTTLVEDDEKTCGSFPGGFRISWLDPSGSGRVKFGRLDRGETSAPNWMLAESMHVGITLSRNIRFWYDDFLNTTTTTTSTTTRIPTEFSLSVIPRR